MGKPRLKREDMGERCATCKRSLITDRERAWGLCGMCIVPKRDEEQERHDRYRRACIMVDLEVPG